MSEPFTFTDLEGQTYVLPSAAKGRASLTGRDMRDALLGGELAMVRTLFKALEACEPAAEALDALYAMPQAETMAVLREWGNHKDEDDTTLGE